MAKSNKYPPHWIIDQNRPWNFLGDAVSAGRFFTLDLIMRNALHWLDEVTGPYLLRISFSQPHTSVLVPTPCDTWCNPALFRDKSPPRPEASLVGTVLTSHAFYGDDPSSWLIWADFGVLAVEMATAALYALAALFHVKALAILTLTDHLVLEAAISTIDRDTALQTMVEIALAMA